MTVLDEFNRAIELFGRMLDKDNPDDEYGAFVTLASWVHSNRFRLQEAMGDYPIDIKGNPEAERFYKIGYSLGAINIKCAIGGRFEFEVDKDVPPEAKMMIERGVRDRMNHDYPMMIVEIK